jgi:[ribosomal protein S18]-alanine N-acetyltransferase
MGTSEAPGRQKAVELLLRPMSQADAEEVSSWRYPGEYSFYDWTSDPADLAELLDPAARAGQYFVVETSAEKVIGFFQYKPPHGPNLEIGLGLHPEWTGRGVGARFLEAGLDFARRSFAPETFQLSVASFNRRAIRVYERAGFVAVRAYMHWTNGAEWQFIEMKRPA